ncbi:MAG: Regulatory protein RecX [Paracidovorax wautersii]|uniref:Regulatory protein RecX n=1 Tax=Paracidovorax wautersii TaxID=1177982 RepID=A0A7V8FPI8_9BURK|nr:MAG: Regulatory protein RecX [Paracidovorax wautersii]
MGFTQLSIKGRALRYLAAREHSRLELARKLAPHEEHPGEIEAALDELQAKGYLSEERVAASLVHRRAARLGTSRLKQELQGKGLSAELVARTVGELRETEHQRALDAWRRKFGEPAATPQERAKQMRFLAGRGFAPEVIRRIVQGKFDDEE